MAQITFIKHYGEYSGQGNSLILNSCNNYIIAGRKYKSSDLDQFCIYELNAYGDTLWLNHYGTDSLEYANQIIQTVDGGYATVGYSSGCYSNYRNIYLVKTTNTGVVSWTKQIGGQGRENGTAIVQNVSGEYFIGGTSSYNSNGLLDFYLVKTNVNGDTLWTKKYGGSQSEEANSMRQTSDGGFILSGYSESFSFGSKDFYVVKTNSAGDTLWTKHYGGSLAEISKSVRQSSDGGYIMTGYSQSFGISTENMYVVKTNSLGDTLWTKTYGQAGRYSWGNDIIQTTDGGYAVTGFIETASTYGGFDLYLVKIDASGNVQWEKEFKIEPANTASTVSAGRSILQTSDGGFAIAGSWFSGSTNELLFIKTDNNGTVGLSELQTNPGFTVFPNPFHQSATLQFENSQNENFTLIIFDSEGRTLRTIVNTSPGKIEIERNNLSGGIYFFQLRTDKEICGTGKFIIE
ncbi:MAG TPA: T9SS type A sorting domain-containing protein [Bacteroidales bacterium]|mgnify:CR=1 FL=1|nr:T9SS type A sorting domain-containing protein [Bacteroidales bacterium]